MLSRTKNGKFGNTVVRRNQQNTFLDKKMEILEKLV